MMRIERRLPEEAHMPFAYFPKTENRQQHIGKNNQA